MSQRQHRHRPSSRGRSIAAAGLVAALLGAAWWSVARTPAYAGEVTVYKSPTCVCCERWLDHMRRAGFRVTERNVAKIAAVKAERGVPDDLASCHTSIAGRYVVEGHVPADLVARLLEKQSPVAGLAVPGMPAGSPGMEGGQRQRYDVLSFTRAGETAVYATR